MASLSHKIRQRGIASLLVIVFSLIFAAELGVAQFNSEPVATSFQFYARDGDFLVYNRSAYITTGYTTTEHDHRKVVLHVEQNTSSAIDFRVTTYTNATNWHLLNFTTLDTWTALETRLFHVEKTALSFFEFRYALPVDLNLTHLISPSVFHSSSLKATYDHYFEGETNIENDTTLVSTTSYAGSMRWHVDYIQPHVEFRVNRVHVNVSYQINRAHIMSSFWEYS